MGDREKNRKPDTLWLDEIIRETEHYFLGEIQQEQRASWILATVGVLLALIVGIQLQLETALKAPTLLITMAQLFLFLSGVFSILTIIPLRGTKLRRDLFGQTYRRDKKRDVEKLIERKFRHGEDWSKKMYEKRLFYHYRSHYLRVRRKEYYVVWASLFFLLGFVFLGIIGIIELI